MHASNALNNILALSLCLLYSLYVQFSSVPQWHVPNSLLRRCLSELDEGKGIRVSARKAENRKHASVWRDYAAVACSRRIRGPYCIRGIRGPSARPQRRITGLGQRGCNVCRVFGRSCRLAQRAAWVGVSTRVWSYPDGVLLLCATSSNPKICGLMLFMQHHRSSYYTVRNTFI